MILNENYQPMMSRTAACTSAAVSACCPGHRGEHHHPGCHIPLPLEKRFTPAMGGI